MPIFSQDILNPDSLAIMPFEHPIHLESNWVDQIEATGEIILKKQVDTEIHLSTIRYWIGELLIA